MRFYKPEELKYMSKKVKTPKRIKVAKKDRLRFLSLTSEDENHLKEGNVISKKALIYRKKGHIRLLIPSADGSIVHHQVPGNIRKTEFEQLSKTSAYRRAGRRFFDVMMWWIFD